MAKDVVYTNGIIAVKENNLFGNKILKLCESGAEEAFRAISESGFGKGADAASVYEYEALLNADERELDSFIREYAPNNEIKTFLLAPRDFHNAKAAFKAVKTGADAEKMFAPDGLVSAEEIFRCIKEGDLSSLDKHTAEACENAQALYGEDGDKVPSGADIGIVFDRAMYSYLFSVCKKSPLLKKLLRKKADMTNILTAIRAETPEYASNNYVTGGKLKPVQLEKLFDADVEKAAHALDGTGYEEFLKLCSEAKEAALPLSTAEQMRDNLEIDYFEEHKFELKNSEPFLYYVYRRRIENMNIRILFVCLLAGLDEHDIKKRLRA